MSETSVVETGLAESRADDPAWFRYVLGQYPTGVTLITATHPDGSQLGMVVGTFSSVSLDPPLVAELVRVRSAREMHEAVLQRADQVDAIVMAAAVADYTPQAGAADAKIAKTEGPLTLTFVRTPDILAELGRARGAAATPLLVGFAAETGDPRPRARKKLAAKQVDLIVANDVSLEGAGFDSETNAAVFISADGEVEQPMQLKTELASKILDRIEQLLASPAPRPGSGQAVKA